jgi:hypothetical protein
MHGLEEERGHDAAELEQTISWGAWRRRFFKGDSHAMPDFSNSSSICRAGLENSYNNYTKGKMKKLSIFLLMVLLIGIMASLDTSFAAEQFKPLTLKFADVVPRDSWFGKHRQWWANEVERRTEGKIKIQMFWMESLVK